MAETIAPRRGPRERGRRAVMTMFGLGAIALAAPGAAWADPPPWAPAQGQPAKTFGAAPGRVELPLTYRVPAGLRDGRCRPEMFDQPGIGGLVGAAAGGFTGSRFSKSSDTLAATAIGALIGAAAGRHAGGGIARSEEVCFSQSFEHVADRETIAWMDPVEGVHYAVTPTKTVKALDGRYCREYTARATVNGQAAGTFGTACRQPDGSWELIN
ncbi:MAG: glycine zipper 2TM domain-containing protein [Alphaproteobacteria bacterium]